MPGAAVELLAADAHERAVRALAAPGPSGERGDRGRAGRAGGVRLGGLGPRADLGLRVLPAQGAQEGARGGEPPRRVLGRRARERVAEARLERAAAGRAGGQAVARLVQAAQQRVLARRGDRVAAGQRLEQDHARRVHVGARVERLVLDRLGRRVVGVAAHAPERGGVLGSRDAGQPVVEQARAQTRALALDRDPQRGERAVHHAAVVRVGERVEDVARQRQRRRGDERPVGVEGGAQRAAGQRRLEQVAPPRAVVGPALADRVDRRVRERLRRRELALEHATRAAVPDRLGGDPHQLELLAALGVAGAEGLAEVAPPRLGPERQPGDSRGDRRLPLALLPAHADLPRGATLPHERGLVNRWQEARRVGGGGPRPNEDSQRTDRRERRGALSSPRALCFDRPFASLEPRLRSLRSSRSSRSILSLRCRMTLASRTPCPRARPSLESAHERVTRTGEGTGTKGEV